MNKIILVKGERDVRALKSLKSIEDYYVYSLDYASHKILDENQIDHEIGDRELNDADLNMIFDRVVQLYNWHNSITNSKRFEIDGVNVLSLLDTPELHTFLADFLYDFVMIKKIIEKESPDKIIANNKLSKIVFLINHNICLEEFQSESSKQMVWDSIEIKLNLGKIPFSFSLSRKNYLYFKNFLERTISFIKNLSPHPNPNSVLFLEMNPIEYEKLIKSFSENDIQVFFLNNRRSPIWNIESIRILDKYDCKLFNPQTILNKNEKNQIRKITKSLINELQSLKSDVALSDFFNFDEISFWSCIYDDLYLTFYNRMYWYLLLLKASKSILENFNFRDILSLNVIGETEKTILQLNKNRIPSIMIEHGFANYTKDISRYDILSMYSLFPDKIAVWGNIQKTYLINEHKIDKNRILVTGSPRHDKFVKVNGNDPIRNKIILISPRPIIDVALHKQVNLYSQYEDLIKRLIRILENFNTVSPIVKLHPGLDPHNNELKKIFQANSNFTIYQNAPIRELLMKSHAVINISPEGFDPSTIILESLILDIPVINIILDKNIYDFEFNKLNAVLTAFNDENLVASIQRLFFDESLRLMLKKNGKNFLKEYLVNSGNASDYLVNKIIQEKKPL